MADAIADYPSLLPFADWALPTTVARVEKRRGSTAAEINAFYTAMLAEIEAVLTRLNQYDIDAIPEADRKLLYLSLSLAEVAPYAEWFGGAPVSRSAAGFEDRLVISSEPA